MKKRVSIFSCILILTLLLGGCAKASAQKESDPTQQIPEEPGVPETTLPESEEVLPAGTSSVPETPVTWDDYRRIFLEDPWSVYTTEEWLTEGNTLEFPFDIYDFETLPPFPTEEWFAYFHIPQDALEAAATESLLQVVKEYGSRTGPWGYNFAFGYYDFVLSSFNATEELMNRSDLAEALLAIYSSEMFMPLLDFADRAAADAYNQQRYRYTNQLLLEEMLLATDVVFEQADEETRERIIEAIMEKEELIQSDEYDLGVGYSAFLAYVIQMHEYSTGSKWYDYIMEDYPDEELKSYIDELGTSSYWLY